MSSNTKPLSPQYNEDELLPPDWLNSDFVQTILRQHELDDRIVVNEICTTPASVKGDHFASIMFRSKVSYVQAGHRKTRSLIIKAMPESDGVKKDMLESSTIFEIEISIYEKIIPKFQEILKLAGDNTIFSPTCLYGSLVPRKCMVFEDLVPLRYEVVRDRPRRLDEVKIVFKKLAKFHAVGYMHKFEDPELFSSYKNGLISVDEFMNTKLVVNSRKHFIELLLATPDLQHYANYFQEDLLVKIKPFFCEYFKGQLKSTPYVLCHGDLHFKNVMFRQSPLDVFLLDYQIAFMGSFVLDVIYASINLLTTEQRLNNKNELTDYYFNEFVGTLKQIGFNGDLPTYQVFKQELLRCKDFELFLFITFLPIWYDLANLDSDMEQMMSSNEYCRKMYQNAAYIDEVRQVLPQYLELGYFEK